MGECDAMRFNFRLFYPSLSSKWRIGYGSDSKEEKDEVGKAVVCLRLLLKLL